MQEEVTQGAVTLIISGARISEQVLAQAIRRFLEAQKGKEPKAYHGRKSLKQLAAQDAGLANIEISDRNIRGFTGVARKYHVDFALKKDKYAKEPKYLVFFKSRDADAITAAFQEFAGKQLQQKEKPSIRERLAQARAMVKPLDRTKVKERELER